MEIQGSGSNFTFRDGIDSGSRDLTKLSTEELESRLEELSDADPEEESEDDFRNCQKEIILIERELEFRKRYGAQK